MSPETRGFSLLSYISVILLFGPIVLSGVLWYGYVARLDFHAWGLPGTPMTWLAVAVGAAAVCILSEWLVLPFLIERDAPRPPYTPLVSFILGMALSGTAFLIASTVM
jgi:hypothetical protein